MKIAQHSNFFNRLVTNFSIELHLLQNMFYKSNSSLIYVSSLVYGTTKYLSRSEVKIMTNPNLFIIVDTRWILTGVGAYSFVTCYSENSLTFDFYITPFKPELWYVLLTTYVSDYLCLDYFVSSFHFPCGC